ncbi:MAG: hypothetical protein PHR24_05335 [Oscillospiraceae bacterium]|nr:hypothetical protein [Oscillospiraceae bacterium]MDD3832355.1 hypothetical protein [Oscillospiraceae bacterium]MDD4546700.1 hypothetical protein [Oscillospiraceae bacterium]
MGEVFEYILLASVLLLSLYGCVELVRSITLRILKTEGPISGILVLPIQGSCKDMEFVVRAAVSRSRWISDNPSQVLILDKGMDFDTRTLAEKLCNEYENVILGSPNECDKIF